MESTSVPIGAKSKVTLWYRMNERGNFDYNHLEDGHPQTNTPTPKVSSQQSGWTKGKWVKELAWLDGNNPPTVLHDPQAEAARILATTSVPG